MSDSAIDRIIRVTQFHEQFWSASHGWAPGTTADLLAEARLDRQLSFVHTLYDFLKPFSPEAAEARQILGYTTLRSLCEGAVKLFFAVFLEDYRTSDDAVFDRKQMLVLPEDLAFDRLITLYLKYGDVTFEPFLRRIQQRGNAIHHFSDRDIGTHEELVADIVTYSEFLRTVDSQLPYPNGSYLSRSRIVEVGSTSLCWGQPQLPNWKVE